MRSTRENVAGYEVHFWIGNHLISYETPVALYAANLSQMLDDHGTEYKVYRVRNDGSRTRATSKSLFRKGY